MNTRNEPIKHLRIAIAAALWLLLAPAISRAEGRTGPEGHWKGSIDVPGAALEIEVSRRKDTSKLSTGAPLSDARAHPEIDARRASSILCDELTGTSSSVLLE